MTRISPESELADKIEQLGFVGSDDLTVKDMAMVVAVLRGHAPTPADRGNYEDRHPNDLVLHPLTEIREWDEALAVLGIQDSDQTPGDAIRERDAEIDRLRALVATAERSFEIIRCKLIDNLNEPERSAFWEAVAARDALSVSSTIRPGPMEGAGLNPASDRKDQSLVEEGGSIPPLAATQPQSPQEPDAWEWRSCIGGRWGAWLYLDQPIERFRERGAINLENGTYELRPLYAGATLTRPNLCAGDSDDC